MGTGEVKTGFFSSIQPKDPNSFDSASPSKPNVFIVTLDEASSGHFQRKLPESWKYLQNEMKSHVYPFYSAIRDGSVDNINNLLTGELRVNMNTINQIFWILLSFLRIDLHLLSSAIYYKYCLLDFGNCPKSCCLNKKYSTIQLNNIFHISYFDSL